MDFSEAFGGWEEVEGDEQTEPLGGEFLPIAEDNTPASQLVSTLSRTLYICGFTLPPVL